MPEQLPIWNALGVEPPTDLKTNGWQPGMKPSAQHMNWLFNRAYKCLEELQNSGANITELSQTVSTLQQTVTTQGTSFTEHLDDYEYQTPTVVDTQIRLIKKSNTNRILFKLETDLIGAITISLDGGATSKNLVDLDGVQLQSVEKGFCEIVQVGNFFILRNRGLSKSDLQALITITNEAEANESVLRTNYVNAVNGADETINLPAGATWNDILLQIPNINAGKKRVANGTITSSNSTKMFTRHDGTSGGNFAFIPFDMTNLDFIPSKIKLTKTDKTGHLPTYWNKENFYVVNSNTANTSYYNYALRAPYINGIVDIPCDGVNTSYTWEAVE